MLRNNPASAKVSEGKWCDYCSCESCQEGWDCNGKILATDCDGNEVVVDAGNLRIKNIECEDGTHICGVCYHDEPWEGCESSTSSFGCEAHHNDPRGCEHRPRIKAGATWQESPNDRPKS